MGLVVNRFAAGDPSSLLPVLLAVCLCAAAVVAPTSAQPPTHVVTLVCGSGLSSAECDTLRAALQTAWSRSGAASGSSRAPHLHCEVDAAATSAGIDVRATIALRSAGNRVEQRIRFVVPGASVAAISDLIADVLAERGTRAIEIAH